jgi:ferredoxin, 2Fe-2S
MRLRPQARSRFRSIAVPSSVDPIKEVEMPKITYVLPDDSEHVVDVPVGQTIMDGSVRRNLPGIVAECGGSCSCATCHVHLDPANAHLFDEASDAELDLLAFADGAQPHSRLSCQLIVEDQAEGVRIVVPDTNG